MLSAAPTGVCVQEWEVVTELTLSAPVSAGRQVTDSGVCTGKSFPDLSRCPRSGSAGSSCEQAQALSVAAVRGAARSQEHCAHRSSRWGVSTPDVRGLSTDNV